MPDPKTFGTKVRHYVLGLLASAYNGGIAAVAGISGIDAAAIMSPASNVHVLTLNEMLAAFAGGFVIHAIFWAKAHPLKETYDTDPPFDKPDPNT